MVSVWVNGVEVRGEIVSPMFSLPLTEPDMSLNNVSTSNQTSLLYSQVNPEYISPVPFVYDEQSSVHSSFIPPSVVSPPATSSLDFTPAELLDIVLSMDARDARVSHHFNTSQVYPGCSCRGNYRHTEYGENCPFVIEYLGLREYYQNKPQSAYEPYSSGLNEPQLNKGYNNYMIAQNVFDRNKNVQKGNQGHFANLNTGISQEVRYSQSGLPTETLHEQIFNEEESNSLNSNLARKESDSLNDTIKLETRYHTELASDDQYSCNDCDSSFNMKSHLAKHIRNIHAEYTCRHCSEKTVGYYRLANHTKKEHAKEPMYSCQCGRNFAEMKGLKKHQNTCNFRSI